MRLEHNTQNIFFRKPFGAVPAGEQVVLRLFVESYVPPARVDCIVNDVHYNMYYLCDMNFGRVFEVKITTKSPCLYWYYFYVEADNIKAHYGNNHEMLGGAGLMCNLKPKNQFQITCYDGNYKTPNWLKHAIFYQIFPDRFYRGAPTIMRGIVREWGEQPYYTAEQFGGEYLSNDFFGGNLQGVAAKLEYLSELGINAIYLNPIFEASTNHKYDTGDYEKVADILGGNQAFTQLCEKAERMGIKIILDGVFNHTGSDSKYFNKEARYDSIGAYQSVNSPFYEWYTFESHPDKYNCWWGFKTLPDLRESSESLRKYLLSGEDAIVKRWLKAGASGWRLDVVDELPGFFLKELARNVKEQDPNAAIIGEVWEDASNKCSYGEQREYFLGGELDSVMNYPLRDAIIGYLRADGNAYNLHRLIMSLAENYPKQHFYCTLNIIGSHDCMRALTALSDCPDLQNRELQSKYVPSASQLILGRKRLKLATLLQMTLPGAPCVYYGDEVGMFGYTDPFNRGCYPWQQGDAELVEFFKQAIKLRNNNPVLRTGEYVPLLWAGKLFAFARRIVNGKDVFGDNYPDRTFVVIINCDVNSIMQVALDLGKLEIETLTEYGNETNIITKTGASHHIRLAPLSAKVYIGG